MKAFLRSLTHPAVASALVALALTALLYGDALTLPLFSDDLVQIPWLESVSWRELWSSPSPYGYYRPLWYTLWRLWGMLVGGLHPPGLHFLNLAAHCAAAWLAGLLAAAWIRPDAGKPRPYIPACLTTALFAAFPFSRQAVAWPGAVYNLLVSAMAAYTVLAYDRGRRGHGTGWIWLALLLTALAPFNYESGLLVGPLVVLTEGVGWMQRRWPHRSRWPLAFAGLFLTTLAIWRTMRGTGVTGFGLTLPDLRRNAGYLVQGLVYPTAPLARCLVARWDLDPELSLWLIALPTLALLAWSGLRWNRGAFWLGMGWFALFALPPVVSMKADWFALAPRFLYMTAVGVSLVWAAAAHGWIMRLRPAPIQILGREATRAPDVNVRAERAKLCGLEASPEGALPSQHGGSAPCYAALPQHLHAPLRPSWRTVAVGAMLVALLTPAVVFIRDGMRLYEMAGESIWNASAAAARDKPLLLVNLPMRITPRSRTYPLGFEGITPLPARVTAEGLVYVHTRFRDAAKAVAFGIVAADEPPGYTYQLFGQQVGWEELAAAVRQTRAVYLTRYEPGHIHLVEAGAYPSPSPSPARERGPLARFGDHVTLLDATCTCDETGWVHLTAYWRAEATVEMDVTVFAHLLGPDGTLVAQADGYPLLGMLPFWLWKPGEVVRDVRHFDTPQPGEYSVALGVWDPASGTRLPATAADGFPWPDQAVLVGPCACGPAESRR